MKKLLFWPASLVAAGVAIYFFWFAFNALRLPDLFILTTAPVLAAIVLAAALYATVIPISGMAWAALLSSQGEMWSVARLSAIMAVTQIAKYIPGGIAQPLGRGAMSSRLGIKIRPLAMSMLQETVLAIAASVVIGLAMLWVSPYRVAEAHVAYQSVGIFGFVAAMAAVFLLARGKILVPEKMRASAIVCRLFEATGPDLGMRVALLTFSAYCINYLVIGIGIWVIGRVLGLPSDGTYPLLTGAFALAWLVGFVVAGAPAGLGVREGAMTAILANNIPQQQILELVIAVRFATLIGDGICFLGGFASLRFLNRARAREH